MNHPAGESPDPLLYDHLLLAYGTYLRLGWVPQWAGSRRIVGTSRFIRKKPVDQVITEAGPEGLRLWCLLPDGREGTAGMQREKETAFQEAYAAVQAAATPEDLASWHTALQELEQKTQLEIARSEEEGAAMAEAMPYRDKGYRVTYGLIAVNVFVFLLMAVSGANLLAPSGEDLVRWGANFGPYTLGGEPWRLFTACFVHIGLIHLALNMYALYQQGMLLEPILGRARLLLAYLATGLFASLTSLWWHGEALSVSAGASGAIFGLFGVFVALLTSKLLPEGVRKQLLRSMGIVIAINLLYGLKAGIDNSAHVGGLLSGFAIGFGLLPGLRKRSRSAAVAAGALLLAVVACAGYVAAHRDDRLEWEKRLERFSAYEARGIRPFSRDTTVVALIGLVRESASAWDSARLLLRDARSLRLPPTEVRRRTLLEQYTELRARQNREAGRQLLGEDGAADSLRVLDRSIDSVLQQINRK